MLEQPPPSPTHPPSMRRKLLIVLSGMLLLVAVAAGAGRLWLGRSVADAGRDGSIPGLTGPVEVWRDSMGVPHLWASSEADLFRALGYVHAQDRLFQMEMFRRVADGRLAEILGPGLVETDRFLRTLGMGRAAGEHQAHLAPGEVALLQAYADGVNAWLAARRGTLPPEFVALRFRPEPWTVRHSVAIGKIMAWDLTEWELALHLQHAIDAVGDELAADLFPAWPDSGLTILGEEARWRGRGEAVATAPRPAAARVRGPVPLPRLPDLALELLDGVSISRASNSWVVAGSRTASGKPILANDMHLALRAPPIWYLAALHGGDLEVTGMTLPGVPGVVAGHSTRVAWGFTNAFVDDADFLVEETDPERPERYRTPAGWAEMVVRTDTIRVKGGEPVLHTVRWTRNGPVLSDVDGRSGGRVLALRWASHEPSSEVTALLAMNRARNVDEFLHALRRFDNPHQNVVFADADGRFGYWMAGRVPVRRATDGLLPAPGWTGEGDWIGWLDFDDHPHALDPETGFVVTANNRQVGAAYPHHISSSWAEPWRAMRIRQLVEGTPRLTAEQALAHQMDVRDLWALHHLPRAVAAAAAAGTVEAEEVLRRWDGEAGVDSRAAALFYTWYDELRSRVGDDEFGEARPYFPRAAFDRLLARGGGAWVDDVRTERRETLEELSTEAMRTAVARVAGRTWGELHLLEVRHPLGSAPALDRLLRLDLGRYPSPGSMNTVNVAGWDARRPPFVTTHGASQRHVVDMADPDGSGGFVLPGGQSGVPFSRHYRDQVPAWREGRLWRIPLDREAASARAVARMTLRPG
jgi:penicillin G amidase